MMNICSNGQEHAGIDLRERNMHTKALPLNEAPLSLGYIQHKKPEQNPFCRKGGKGGSKFHSGAKTTLARRRKGSHKKGQKEWGMV